jgi:hypothetical protein
MFVLRETKKASFEAFFVNTTNVIAKMDSTFRQKEGGQVKVESIFTLELLQQHHFFYLREVSRPENVEIQSGCKPFT